MGWGFPRPPPGPTSLRISMDTFLARTSWLCRAGSSWQATASICRQQFCTMALGRRAKGRVRAPAARSKALWPPSARH